MEQKLGKSWGVLEGIPKHIIDNLPYGELKNLKEEIRKEKYLTWTEACIYIGINTDQMRGACHKLTSVIYDEKRHFTVESVEAYKSLKQKEKTNEQN